MAEVEFYVPGKPQAQGSKVKGRYGNLREDNKELGPWRERVALSAHAAMGGAEMIEGPVSMTLLFTLYRPASAPKNRTPPATKKPDLDKMTRAIFDALTGICFHDDSQVVTLTASKRVASMGEGPGVRVVVRPAHQFTEPAPVSIPYSPVSLQSV